jgi:hypothetical protein
MRVASLPLLAITLLLTDCGSSQDLVIGELLLTGEAGTASNSAGSAGAESTGGAVAAAGTAGSTGAVAGSDAGGMDAAGAAGVAGSSEENCVAGSEPPQGSLIHRYSFDGTTAVATDAISGADGNVITTINGAPVATPLDGSGVLSMDGKAHKYVDLPNGIVSSLTDITVVTWMTWVDGAAYQRVFDFGISTQGEGLGDAGRSYLAVMPKTGFDNQLKPGLGGEMKAPGFPTVTLASAEDMRNRPAQVAFVLKGGLSAALYLDGNLLASQTTAITLADIDDRNNWIGQSQYSVNPPFWGSYEEFRIYNVPLDGCQLHTLLVRGPQSP